MFYLVRETTTVSWGVAETTITEMEEPTPSYGCSPVISTIVTDRSMTLAAGEIATVIKMATPPG